MVDWTATLWPCSFQGVPFHVERASQQGGRRLVVHEFPARDVPYVEDMGEAAGRIELSAYVASDSALAGAAALSFACSSGGPGLLVLPDSGPRLVRCQEWRREHERDRLGYVAFSLTFVREGAASALAGVAMLANMVFTAAGAIGSAASALVGSLALAGMPAGVVAAAVGQFRDGVAVLETVRTGAALSAPASAAARDELDALYAGAPVLFSRSGAQPAAGSRLVEAARLIGDGMDPPRRPPPPSERCSTPSRPPWARRSPRPPRSARRTSCGSIACCGSRCWRPTPRRWCARPTPRARPASPAARRPPNASRWRSTRSPGPRTSRPGRP